jgi:hypothetical protein
MAAALVLGPEAAAPSMFRMAFANLVPHHPGLGPWLSSCRTALTTARASTCTAPCARRCQSGWQETVTHSVTSETPACTGDAQQQVSRVNESPVAPGHTYLACWQRSLLMPTIAGLPKVCRWPGRLAQLAQLAAAAAYVYCICHGVYVMHVAGTPARTGGHNRAALLYQEAPTFTDLH